MSGSNSVLLNFIIMIWKASITGRNKVGGMERQADILGDTPAWIARYRRSDTNDLDLVCLTAGIASWLGCALVADADLGS